MGFVKILLTSLICIVSMNILTYFKPIKKRLQLKSNKRLAKNFYPSITEIPLASIFKVDLLILSGTSFL